ncbi:putative mycofactocin biosynthesis glycosyltransferase MftF [Chlorella vulgaris]
MISPQSSIKPTAPLRRPRPSCALGRRKPPARSVQSPAGGDGGGDIGGGTGGSGSGGGGGSDDNSSSWHLPGGLCCAGAWALCTECLALWQHRKAAARDAERRAQLFDGAGSLSQSSGDAAGREATVSIIVPALNEETGLEGTLRYLQKQLQPAAAEIIVVDGGSSDRTVSVARRCGVRVVHAGRGRARQMNAGAAAAKGQILVFAHADTQPPQALVAEVRRQLSQPNVVLGGFRPLIEFEGKPLRAFSANNTLKTYYGPLLLRPLSFLRGLRCLFGDQTLFCRAADFRNVGGYDGRLPIMEDADLSCWVNSVPNHTSGRRLAQWGGLRATAIHVIIGLSWYCGATPEQLRGIYHRLYTDLYRG